MFQRVTLTFVALAIASLAASATCATLASFPLALVGRAFAVFSLASTKCVITAPRTPSRRFPGQLQLPSHPALRLHTVPNRSSSAGKFSLPKALARTCHCCSPSTEDDTTSGVRAWSLQRVPPEVVHIGPETLWSRVVGALPKVCRKLEVQLLESLEDPEMPLVRPPWDRTRNRKK